MSHRDPGDEEKDDDAPRPEELSDEAIIEWLARDPQRSDSREFRDRVMRDIRRQRPNIHREALSARRRGPLATLLDKLHLSSISAMVVVSLILGFVAGFVAGAAFGGLPASGEHPLGMTASHRQLSVLTADPDEGVSDRTTGLSPSDF